jgi:Hydroxylase for synthesis of 2-methylthio-cis-ribozeatin in tRNA
MSSTSNSSKTKLGLELPTDPRWVNLAEKSLEEILTDHAYCEQKAATSCITLIQKFPDYERLVDEVAPIVTEEWGHFRMVIAELKKRNMKLGFQRKDLYVSELMKYKKGGGSPQDQLLEHLLVFALIEARSCERFRLLSLHMQEAELRSFYHHFMVSEAGHYKMFINLARHYCGEEKTAIRWAEYLSYEADVLSRMSPSGDRMH